MENNSSNPKDDIFDVNLLPEGYTVLPPATYKAEYVEVTVEKSRVFQHNNFVTVFEVVEIPEGVSAQTNYSEYVGCKTHGLHKIALGDDGKAKAREKGTIRQMMNALLGQQTKNSGNMNIATLIGKQCYIKVEMSKDPKKQDYVNKIVRYFPISKIEKGNKNDEINPDQIDIIY